ncbi:hypothetical protein [Acinetobacter stercoris]|uniref:DUF4156 domain-containing protein n=1 Tax=Acinetobacter stercoris TaxID=2126983 RepID=A0A2U3MVB0_9GAMM|nr:MULTISPECIES: hypothetical protein [Acinetobacter]SPL69377.1 hypothetical protein KPC_0555 [Acinetobacter stercoris]
MKMIKIYGLALVVLGLTACQTTPRQYNGVTGYQIENKSANSATLAYTLAGRSDRKLDENKLQRACQKVLGASKTYKISVLSVNEIINPQLGEKQNYGVQLGHSRTSVGLSNTPDLSNNRNLATDAALNTRPSTLHVVRYTCS